MSWNGKLVAPHVAQVQLTGAGGREGPRCPHPGQSSPALASTPRRSLLMKESRRGRAARIRPSGIELVRAARWRRKQREA
jgi:hypothetical protein